MSRINRLLSRPPTGRPTSSPDEYIDMRGGRSLISCAYPLNAPSSEITSYMGLGYLALAMSNTDTTGTYTVLGAPASQKAAGAGPVGFSNGTAATMSFTSGSKVIAWSTSVPAAVDTGSSTQAYELNVGLYTTAIANVASIDIKAQKDSTWLLRVLSGAGFTAVYTLTSASCPTTVALVMNADASTFSAYFDGVPVTFSGSNAFTPGNMVALEVVTEFTTSDAGDAGKTITATQYTEAATIPGAYQPGVTDPCGNNLPANYLVDNLGNLLEDNSGNLLVWV